MTQTNQTNKTVSDTLILEKQKILDAIGLECKYEKENCLIRRWEGSEDTDSFIAHISNGKSNCIGVLNGKIDRNGYGINTYENGDVYFGYFEKDKRDKHGVYIWPTEEKNGIKNDEMYYGFWKENIRDHHGIYLWMKNYTNSISFEEISFDAYVGTIDDDRFKKGTHLSKVNDEYFLYYGGFDMNGMKNDDDAMYYSGKCDRLMQGKIVNEVFTEGYVAFFNSNGEISNIVYVEFEGKEKIRKMTMKENINEEERKKNEEKMITFRNIILGEDYFGEIFKRYREIKNFIKENMQTIDVLDDKEKFPDIIKLCVGYNEKNIYSDIENKMNIK